MRMQNHRKGRRADGGITGGGGTGRRHRGRRHKGRSHKGRRHREKAQGRRCRGKGIVWVVNQDRKGSAAELLSLKRISPCRPSTLRMSNVEGGTDILGRLVDQWTRTRGLLRPLGLLGSW